MSTPGRKGDGMRDEHRAAVEEVAEFYNLLFAQNDDLDYEAELYDYEDEDEEGPLESLLRHAPEIEAGLMPG